MAEEGFYTTAFTSQDFVEGDAIERAEVFVVEGQGLVNDVVESSSGKSLQVVIDAHKEFKGKPMYSKGWAPIDSAVIKKAQEAQEKGIAVDFRIETVRNKGVDRSTPIAELKKGMENARNNVMHSVARIKLADEDSWTDGIMRTNPKEDTKRTGRSALDLSDDEISSNSGNSSNSSANVSTYTGLEPQPWATRNSAGDVNPGSLAVSVPLTLYSFVAAWNKNNDSNVEISEKQRMVLTKALLSVSNKLQVSIYEGKLESPDLSLGSHTRARALVFNVVEVFFPITEEVASSNENVKEWMNEIHDKALAMWKWSIGEIDKLS